ncbi:PolC-type DNA polymerase III [Suicoccus acidiformans]|uniref:DNA polymerase III PolC-type n=1 Tax=Suicoccus acidiformans TaxID=2036206 RepID=A0A347WK62_9LACT|nr:PolC-type DNA polymerase III [Suicoccus acidiformans]AXY25469.1 PolC-type DNA polymerase III [Suicoccus acidiformans]
MADQRDLFVYLLDQIQLHNEDIRAHLSDVEVDHVDILVNSKRWVFYFNRPERIYPDAYEIFQKQIVNAFKDIAEIEVWWQFDQLELDEADIENYFAAVVRRLSDEKPFVKACMENAQFHYEVGKVSIGLSSPQSVEMVQGKYHEILQMRLKQMGIENLSLEYYVDEALRSLEESTINERKSQEDEASLLEALRQQEERQEQQARAEMEQASDVEPIGKDIPPTSPTPMKELEDNQFKQVIEGYVFSKEVKELRGGNLLMILGVTDYTSSVTVKLISGRRIKATSFDLYNKGDWVRMEGDMVPDNYTSELYFRPRSMRNIAPKYVRYDKAPEGERRVELHAHTQMSQLDATNSAADIIKQAAAWGHPAVAITDHAGVQAFPEAFNMSKQLGIKVIYGCEIYLVNDGEPVAYNEAAIPLKDATYVVFDVETTGLSNVYDDIIELAGVKMKEGEVIDRFERFVHIDRPLSSFITELTSITDDMLKDAPDLKSVMTDFKAFCEGCILVAHNASFDMGFINKGYQKVGLEPTDAPVIDTLELSRTVNPEFKTHGLGVLAKRYNITLEQHHRAIYDSETTGYILFKMLAQAKEMYGMVEHQDLNQQMGQNDSYQQGRPMHATLLVQTQIGLKNLFKIVSEANVNYFYRTPRVPRSLLKKYREGLLVGTACAEGEVFTAMMQKGYDEARDLVDFYDYIELQPKAIYQTLIADEVIRDEATLEEIMRDMVRLGEETGKTVVATGDVHYIDPKDQIYREVLLRSMKANANRKLNLAPAHFRTTDEMLAEFAFLGEQEAYTLVVENSLKIADSIEEIEVIKKDLYTPIIEGAEEEIKAMTYGKAHEMYGNPLPTLIEERLEKELTSIISNGFAVIYLISQKLVLKSNEDGYLVGSRGSVGSSLVATLTGITEVNPLAPHYYCQKCHHNEFFTEGEYGSGYDLPDKACPECGELMQKDGQDIPFETFLGFYGDKVPDIDLNFSGDYQARAHAYTKELFGEDYVYRAGTIGTVAQKTALGYVRGYEEHTGEMLPQAERERLAYGIEGAKRTTGQHPGGIIVIPDNMEVYDFTPIQYPADDNNAEWKTTHFDFHSIDNNVLKLDILGHDDPTMIRMLFDLTGVDPQKIPAVEEKVMQIFQGTEVLGVTPEQIYSETGTLGVPEFGTNFVRGMVAETKPSNFAELLKISGLSHGTDVWLGNAQDLIRNNVIEFSEVIGCRDDIMVNLIHYGLEDGLAFKIMESVRKGKGIPDDWQAEMRAHNVPEWYIESCLKIKYMFPKAHAAAYVLNALRIAYFKVYYPIQYYAAYFSIRAKDFDLTAFYQGKEMVKRRIREINDKGFTATNKETTLLTELEIANEMLERGYRFQMVNLEKSDARNFVIDGDSLIPPFRAIPGLGANVADQIVKAREEASFLSKEDLQKRGKVSKTIMEYMDLNGVLEGLPEEDQLSLF